jgi:hypothetical protein
MSVELRGPQDAERWLCAGLSLARLEGSAPEALAEAVPWLLAALTERQALPPLGALVDLGRLGAGAPLASGGGAADVPPRLRAAVRAYEDHLLARLAADPHLEAAVNALARMPAALRPRGLAFLAGRVLERIEFSGGAAVSPGLVRRVLERPPGELLQAGFAALRQPAVVEWMAEGYEALAAAARRARALLGEAEVFTLENLEQLQGLAQRLALEQVVEAAEALEQALPARPRSRPPPRGRIPASLEDEAAYPQGGFSSVSNVGSLENLVTSELIYMEDEAGLDLFDVRYVEGELLYYTRDESLFVRRRRVVTFVLQPGLAEARVKDAGLRWQRLVLVLGLVLGLVRRLTVWLREEDLRFRVVFVSEQADPGPLEAERGLSELLLREWRARGIAEVEKASVLDEVLTQAVADAKRARVDVVLIGAGGKHEVGEVDARVGVTVLDVSQPHPRASGGPLRERAGRPLSAWEAWMSTMLELAQGLL